MIIHKAYQFRLCPTVKQEKAMVWTLDRCREVYNAGLEERIGAYKRAGKTLSCYEQCAELLGVKEVRPEYQTFDAHMLRDPIKRLDRAFKAFFRRVKAGRTPGFPRFKGRDRYDSFTFQQGSGWKIAGNRLSLKAIGAVRMKLHRPIEGTIKTVTIRRDADQWYVSFSCVLDMAYPVVDPTLPSVGIDVGLEHFLTTSDGEHIANPRHFRQGQETLTRRSQVLARKKRGSHRRKKAKLLVAKAHRKVRNQRKDFHHKTARTLVGSHSLIAVEALRTANLTKRPAPILATTEEGQEVYLPNGATAKSGLNKSIADAGWASFIAILRAKAEEAGRVVIAVNPAGTSQACSGCGTPVPKALSERWHSCEHCGCSLQRDVNAARNILTGAGLALQASA